MAVDTLRLETAFVADFVRRYPEEAAKALERMAPEAVASRLDRLPPAHTVAVLEHMTAEAGAAALARMTEAHRAAAVGRMEPGRAVSLLTWFEPADREHLVSTLPEAVARELNDLAKYPSDTAGHHMDPRVLVFRPDSTVRATLTRLRTARRRTDTDVPVVDDEGHLVGSVTLQDLAVASPTDSIGHLPLQPPVSVLATATRAEVSELAATRRATSLPVVDIDGRLLGMLGAEALMSVTRDDVGADIQAMVGVSREERVFSKIPFAVRRRLPWLHINLLTAFVAAGVVGLFEDTIARFTALAVLLPVVAGQSGNTGAQALAVTMRGLVLREARVRQWPRIAMKECTVALVNGLGIAITTSAGVLLWSGSPGLAGVIGVSMVLSMVAAGLAGAVIPIALTAGGQDPAQASSIILTTVTDVVGFFSFLGLAALMAERL